MSRFIFPFIPLFCLFIFCFFVWSLAVVAQRPDTPTRPGQEFRPIAVPPTQQTTRAKRIREGTTFKNVHVFFRQTDNRTVVYTVGDNQRYTCHENLTLERTLIAIQEKPEREYWKIDGEFSEFQGKNFVFIRRAVVALPPVASPPVTPPPPIQ